MNLGVVQLQIQSGDVGSGPKVGVAQTKGPAGKGGQDTEGQGGTTSANELCYMSLVKLITLTTAKMGLEN